MKRTKRLLVFAAGMTTLVASLPVAAQTPAHIAAVKSAQGAAYAINQATNGCPVVGTDMLGWPGASIRKCIYRVGPAGNKRTGLVYLLEIKPETIATWIEGSCAKLLPSLPGCFEKVLTCGKLNSGMMFPISGNMLEDMTPSPWQNFFFRNGMTVRMAGQPNGTTTQVPLDRQEALAQLPDTGIERIPSGLTRFWRTRPEQFAAQFPAEGVPAKLDTPAKRQKWLDTARAEILAAMNGPTNRLLETWVAVHATTLASPKKCPDDSDP